MNKIKMLFNSNKKFRILTYMIALTVILSIVIPTLAKYKNRISYLDVEVWDGSVATSYKSGTGEENNPYIISNGAELAYFSEQLQNNDYHDNYFKLDSDIALNDGILKYVDGTGITYIKGNNTYYINPTTGEYFDNAEFEGTKIGNVNLFTSLNNFKGEFDASNYTIYGLFIVGANVEQVSLFTNLSGKINNLYVDNSIIYGGYATGGIASKTNNATIENTIFNGYVVGEKAKTIKNEEVLIDNISILNVPYQDTKNISLPFITGDITSTKLSGSISLNSSNLNDTNITINGNRIDSLNFELNLGTSITSNLNINVSGVKDNILITNLKYTVTYEYASAGGIVGEANSSIINNSINKGSIYSYLKSAGIVGVEKNNSISNSYNEGTIVSNGSSSGLVNMITGGTSTISNCYNEGEIIAPNQAGIIYTVKDENSLEITNSFNTGDVDYNIDNVSNSNVSITNSYSLYGDTVKTGNTTGEFTTITLNNLKNKTNMINNLNYKEFISNEDLNTNPSNIWKYEEELPKLYIDEDMIIANIHASTYTWDSFSTKLENKNFNSNITFMINNASSLRPLKEIYYYISNSATPLNKSELENINSWNIYNNIEEINDEGFYIIYAKAIDYNDEVTYLNSDVLVLDKSASTVNITVSDKTWNNLRTNIDYKYFNKETTFEIEASDLLSGIESIKYYITNTIIPSGDLNSIDQWIDYTTPVVMNNNDKKIVYVKVTDNCGFATYVNTDYLSLNGYTENDMTIGRNTTNNLDNINITNKSIISLNYSYIDDAGYSENYTHNLISSILLPVNTSITLIDRNTGNAYKYIIPTSNDNYNYNSSCSSADCIKTATYPLTLFKTLNENNQSFNEITYYSTDSVNENFKVVIDFSNTLISDNINDIYLYLETRSTNGKILRSTINSTIKKFNIYSNVNSVSPEAKLYLNTNYAGASINYNSDSTTNININTGFNYKTIDSKIINDTTNEDKNIGLLIKLVNSNNEVVSKDDLNNIFIRVDSFDYGADEDGIFRINLNNGIQATTKTLSVITSEASTKLASGNYELKIYSYAAYDGLHSNDLASDAISIPVTISNTYQSNIAYKFDVMIDDSYKIMNKNSNGVDLSFNIIEKGQLSNPNVRVSLYKKDLPTAFDQNYSKVNLQTYTSKNLTSCDDKVYYAIQNPIAYNGRTTSYNNFSFNLKTNNLENTGYRFLFELYDGNKKIGEIKKNFIIK